MKSISREVEKQWVQPKNERIILAFLVVVGVLLTSIFAYWWFLPSHIPHNFVGMTHIIDYILFGAVTYVVWYQILMELLSWDLALYMKKVRPILPIEGHKVAFITAFVPGKEPYEMLETTLTAMTKCDYSHDTWVLDEGNDPKVKAICKRLKVKHFSRLGIEKYNQPSGTFKAKTKGGNHNAWYDKHAHSYEFVAQIDVDFVPTRDFLTKTLGYFADPKVAFVGTPQIYGNKDQSWIARGAAEQAYGFYGHIMRGLFARDMTFLIGSNHVTRVSAHKAIGGYVGHITEDHITGMTYYRNRFKSVYVDKVLAVGEGPSTWESYFNQQTRWATGLIHILFRHSPNYFRKMHPLHSYNYLLMQQFYFYGITQGLGVALLFLYFVLGISSTNITLLSLAIFYVPVLLMQVLLFVFCQRYTVNPKEESGALWAGRFLNFAAWPIYLLSFFSVITGKKMVYQVTPKGEIGKQKTNLRIFLPHFVLGTITLVCIPAAFIFHRYSPLQFFFCLFNTVTMYSFIAMAAYANEEDKIKNLALSIKWQLADILSSLLNPSVPEYLDRLFARKEED